MSDIYDTLLLNPISIMHISLIHVVSISYIKGIYCQLNCSPSCATCSCGLFEQKFTQLLIYYYIVIVFIVKWQTLWCKWLICSDVGFLASTRHLWQTWDNSLIMFRLDRRDWADVEMKFQCLIWRNIIVNTNILAEWNILLLYYIQYREINVQKIETLEHLNLNT